MKQIQRMVKTSGWDQEQPRAEREARPLQQKMDRGTRRAQQRVRTKEPDGVGVLTQGKPLCERGCSRVLGNIEAFSRMLTTLTLAKMKGTVFLNRKSGPLPFLPAAKIFLVSFNKVSVGSMSVDSNNHESDRKSVV